MPVKKTEWWGAGVVICLERGADLHMAQLIPLPLTVSCFRKIQIGLTFLVPAHLGSPGKRAVRRVCVCVPLLLMGLFAAFLLKQPPMSRSNYINMIAKFAHTHTHNANDTDSSIPS